MAERMAGFGISNLSTGLCRKQDISFIISSELYMYIYRTYMKEHYGLNIFFQPEGRSDLSVFKVICYQRRLLIDNIVYVSF